MLEVKGRKRRDTKLGIVEAMRTAKVESMRVVGESFSLKIYYTVWLSVSED